MELRIRPLARVLHVQHYAHLRKPVTLMDQSLESFQQPTLIAQSLDARFRIIY